MDISRDRVLISLGSNLGRREDNLVSAVSFLVEEGVQIVNISSLFETEPLGLRDQPDFLNACCEIRTGLAPLELLRLLLRAESNFGRVRHARNGPRPIDLDLLFYGRTVNKTSELVLPHPRLRERAFVLVPLTEIASDFVDPLTERTVEQLLEICPDRSRVVKVGRFPFEQIPVAEPKPYSP